MGEIQLQPRDEQILAHIGLYRLSFRAIIERLYCSKSTTGNVIQRLAKARLIQSRGGLAGRLVYYQLTATACSQIGLARNRAESLGPAALSKHISILCWCCAGKQRRHRLEPKELNTLTPVVGDSPPSGDHCIRRSAGNVNVTRVFVASDKTQDPALIQRTRKTILKMTRDNPALAGSLERGDYRCVILVERKERRQHLEGILKKDEKFRRLIRIRTSAGPASISEVLKKLPRSSA